MDKEIIDIDGIKIVDEKMEQQSPLLITENKTYGVDLIKTREMCNKVFVDNVIATTRVDHKSEVASSTISMTTSFIERNGYKNRKQDLNTQVGFQIAEYQKSHLSCLRRICFDKTFLIPVRFLRQRYM
jgi:hypothetical protein